MTIQEAIENRERCYRYLVGCGERATKENVEAVRLSLEALYMYRGWVPVSEPPKEKGDYLCYFKYEPESPDVVCQTTYIGNGQWVSEQDKITHWMPLPQAPKED